MGTPISWGTAAALLNSNFVSGMVGALAGAFAGAIAAQRVGDRAKERDAVRAEIRNINAAVVTAHSIWNVAMSLKKQFVKEIYERYNRDKARFLRHMQGAEGNQKFTFRADCLVLQVPRAPIDTLKTQVYERISVGARPLALMGALAGSFGALAEVIQRRNVLIERFQLLRDNERDDFPARYFGVPYGGGHVSTDVGDLIEGLYRLTDDVMFFSRLLAEDVTDHGKRMKAKYDKVARIKKEGINQIEFSDARTDDLMPDPANYQDWLQGFSARELER